MSVLVVVTICQTYDVFIVLIDDNLTILNINLMIRNYNNWKQISTNDAAVITKNDSTYI